MEGPPNHTAQYTEDGNIILPSNDSPMQRVRRKKEEPKQEIQDSSHVWTIVEETASERAPESFAAKDLLSIRSQTKGILSMTLMEAEQELQDTAQEFQKALKESKTSVRSFPQRIRRGASALGSILIAPLSFEKGNKKPKPRSKTFLFMVDTIRFGGTFAGIFLLLFVGINAPSFWTITKAQLALGEDVQTVQGLQRLTEQSNDPESVTRITHQGQIADVGSIVGVLPPVGPPENRLVIPKLGQNIPIVNPPTGALLKEDWTQFEKDIQDSLQHGVVHYPGTAKPGQAGNFFVTGHSSYYPWDSGKFKEVFARLNELTIGDEYSVYYGGDLHTYRVTKKLEVKPTNVAVLDQPTDKRIATLMTCTPIGTTLRRLIVQAEEIDPQTGVALHVGEKSGERFAPAKLEMLPI